MTVKSRILRTLNREDVNFVLTNRLPRRVLNRFAGWFSRIEQPLVRDLSIGVWRFFSDLDLSEARDSRFRSMHDCFTRRLKPGARPIDQDPNILVSPCDAIVGAHGAIRGTTLYQIKGAHYELPELLCDDALAETYHNGRYVTLRLTSSMYHRFHAAYDCRVEHVAYIPGDTWNVNPAALRRVDKLSARTNARCCARGLRRPATSFLWFRSEQFSSPVSGCILSMSNAASSRRAATASAAPRSSEKATK